MKHLALLSIATVLLFVMGCASAKPDYEQFFKLQPRSILVVPPTNKTTAVDAPMIFLTTVSGAFAERGYYVFPVFLVQDILNDLGATDEGAIAAVPPIKFKEVFGADSILYVTLTDWTTSYVLLSSSITVGAEYRLVDAATGTVLWTHSEKLIHQSGGQGLVGILVSAAMTAASVQYRPIAIRANDVAVKRHGEGGNGYGVPAGAYHPQFQQDRAYYQ